MDKNMWTILAPIIARYGIEFASKLWGNIKSTEEPTEAQWEELRAVAAKSYDDYIAEAKTKV
jgi:hypothetical protein